MQLCDDCDEIRLITGAIWSTWLASAIMHRPIISWGKASFGRRRHPSCDQANGQFEGPSGGAAQLPGLSSFDETVTSRGVKENDGCHCATAWLAGRAGRGAANVGARIGESWYDDWRSQRLVQASRSAGMLGTWLSAFMYSAKDIRVCGL
jgi:hypothetical protein